MALFLCLSLTLLHIEDLISPVLAVWGRQCPISVRLLVPVTLLSLVACPLFMCGLERFRTSEYLEEQVTARAVLCVRSVSREEELDVGSSYTVLSIKRMKLIGKNSYSQRDYSLDTCYDSKDATCGKWYLIINSSMV